MAQAGLRHLTYLIQLRSQQRNEFSPPRSSLDSTLNVGRTVGGLGDPEFGANAVQAE